MRKFDDQSRSLVALDQDSTLIAVIEMSQTKWLVGGLVPGPGREPEKGLVPDAAGLLQLLERWRAEGAKAGRQIARICVAYEAGRDGFWLARWLRARGIECHVIHPTSIPVTREHRRAKTDRLDLGLLKRAFLGWLRGAAKHCRMAPIPSLAEEDARRAGRERQTLRREASRIVNRLKASLARLGIRNFTPKRRNAAARLDALRTGEGEAIPPLSLAELQRELARLALVRAQIKAIAAERQQRLAQAPELAAHRMTAQLARVHGLGLETGELLATEAVWARLARSARGGTPGRADRGAGREREAAPREGAGARRQCARAPRHDPARLAVAQISAAE
jgi:transposase